MKVQCSHIDKCPLTDGCKHYLPHESLVIATCDGHGKIICTETSKCVEVCEEVKCVGVDN